MTKKQLLEEIQNYQPTNARNRMGCSESWYDSVFAMKETFSIQEIEDMSEKEIANLLKLANNISMGLY